MENLSMGEWPIIDADAHVTEQADIWTSRMPKKWADVVPRVERHPGTGQSHWRIGDVWFWQVAGAQMSQVGWREPLPSSPAEYEDADPACFDATERLNRMDEMGIDIQILYPNLIGFATDALIPLGLDVSVAAVQAYNDYIWEWSSADHNRLKPAMSVPFWDIDASLAEMKRCADMGFKSMLFANKFEKIGLPGFSDPHWDPIYATAEEMGLPVNYHIGFGVSSDALGEDSGGQAGSKFRENNTPEARKANALYISSVLMENDHLLGLMLTSGLFDKFPDLKVVNVETGIGHVAYYLESLDWHWKVHNNADSMPMLPSEYFIQNCYNTFWFEKKNLSALEQFPDNFMFSTDFPHGTGLGPGPNNATTLMPSEFVRDSFAGVPATLRDKALYANANKVYGFDLKPRPISAVA